MDSKGLSIFKITCFHASIPETTIRLSGGTEAGDLDFHAHFWGCLGNHFGLIQAESLILVSKCFIILKLSGSDPSALDASHSHILQIGPGTTGERSDPQSQARILPSPIHGQCGTRWNREKCSSPPDMQPETGLVLNPETKKRRRNRAGGRLPF
jgi:hypothetical protein